MQIRIQKHIRNNIVGYVAVFLAMTGTAVALPGTNTVDSPDIINGEVKTPDVAANAVTTGKIREGAVGLADLATASVDSSKIADNSLTGNDALNGSLSGADVGDNSLGGADIQESTLGQVPSALLGGFGRTGAEAGCDPESTTFVTCAFTGGLAVPPGARALIIARVRARAESGADSGFGECRLRTSSIGAVPDTQLALNPQSSVGPGDKATLVGITPPLPQGATSFGIECNQSPLIGAIVYDEASASVVLISAV